MTRWFSFLFRRKPEQPERPLRLPSTEKVDKKVLIYTLAVEQCRKPAKLPELERNLAFWKAIRKAAQSMNGEI